MAGPSASGDGVTRGSRALLKAKSRMIPPEEAKEVSKAVRAAKVRKICWGPSVLVHSMSVRWLEHPFVRSVLRATLTCIFASWGSR